MRLSVPVFLLVISLTPFTLAQHSGGGGGGGGGGGASAGASAGGSHGGSSSGGSWSGSSGGHGSGGSASHTSAGGHGSNGGTSHSRSGTSDPNKHSRNEAGRFESSGSYVSDIPRESAAVREHLLEDTLDRMELDVPSNLKTDRPISLHVPKHKGPGADNLLVGKNETSKKPEPTKKPFEDKRFCGPGSAGRRCTVPSNRWNIHGNHSDGNSKGICPYQCSGSAGHDIAHDIAVDNNPDGDVLLRSVGRQPVRIACLDVWGACVRSTSSA